MDPLRMILKDHGSFNNLGNSAGQLWRSRSVRINLGTSSRHLGASWRVLGVPCEGFLKASHDVLACPLSILEASKSITLDLLRRYVLHI